ncbi:MAG: 3-isopropylmalate dehydrogenase [Thermomicrobiales bacterium]
MGITVKIALLPGDGIGPEIVVEAKKSLDAVAQKFGHQFDYQEVLIGGAAIDAFGVPVRDEDLGTCLAMDGVLLGAIGGPKWDDPTGKVRPEQGLLKLRKSLGLFANLRPVAVMAPLADTSPVKADIVKNVDIIVVRELTGGLYFGRPSRQWQERRGRVAVDTLLYREYEIERVVRLAFDLARGRKQKVTSVDKANVLSTSRLWRSIVSEVAKDYPDVELEHALVDSMTMQLIRRPAQFDVIVTENMFGDILTDEASVLAGSIGLLPSASIGANNTGSKGGPLGVYEPIHGSSPAMTGQGRANPTGTILSGALMLRLSLGLADEAAVIESAVTTIIERGIRTHDIADPGATPVSTSEFGSAVAGSITNG